MGKGSLGESAYPGEISAVEYAAIGQQPRELEGDKGIPFVGNSGDLARDYLKGAGLDVPMMFFGHVYQTVLPQGQKPTSTAVKHGIERIKAERAHFRNLQAVAPFVSHLATAAFSLCVGITRAPR